MANRADRLHVVLEHERTVVAPSDPSALAGWGVGFYQGGEVLHKKRPLLPGEALDWEQLSQNVCSDCVVVHLRQATVGDFRLDNTHPFRMGSWLFAHKGTVDRFDAVRERLLEQMPDFLRRNIRGQTDSEHLFHVILSFLHDGSHLDRSEIDDDAILNAMRSTLALFDRLGAEVGAQGSTYNWILTNGRRMFALRRGLPMVYAHRQGLEDTGLARPGQPSALRYVLVVSNGARTPVGYTEVPEGSVCVVDRSLQIHIRAL
jgi:glutamine amidotransferase